MTKLAILQMADQGPAESTAAMLRAVGYNVFLPNKALRDQLRAAGLDTVLSPRDLTASMGYDPVALAEIGPEGIERCDLFCDIKAHRNYPRIVKRWPRLENRILWTRINGGKFEHVIKNTGEDCGDEVHPPCPVLTPNLWYRKPFVDDAVNPHAAMAEVLDDVPWNKFYACWPPFVRFDEVVRATTPRGLHFNHYTPPLCLIHRVEGWGYSVLMDPLRKLGIKMFGAGSPDGLLQHQNAIKALRTAKCMVHLKSSDAPGYALYEALAAACPVVCTHRLIWRCKMESLLIPNETCLTFDHNETHAALSPEQVEECVRELKEHLARLSDPTENRRIGENGRKRLLEVMWSADKPEDVASLRQFMERNFP